jgi:hypothetical protein
MASLSPPKSRDGASPAPRTSCFPTIPVRGADATRILDILRDGCVRANRMAEETLALAKDATKLQYFDREIRYV